MEKSGFEVPNRMPAIHWIDEYHFRFSNEYTVYKADLTEKKIHRLNSYPEEARNRDLHEGTGDIAYTIENNLFISRNGNQIQLTFDEDKDIINGQTVHRNEFGISKGTYWSPSGKYLAYYRNDQTMVTDYPIVNIEERIAVTENIKYPMAGMTSEQVNLVIYNLSDGSHVTIGTGEPAEQYLTSVTWDPNEKFIYIALLNRDQNHLKLNKYDIEDGSLVKTLFEEKDQAYVEPEHPLYFLPSSPGQFIWTSERDGYQHLYQYSTDGNLIKQLTRGEWVVTDLLGADPAGTQVYFESTVSGPLNRELCSVNLKTGKVSILSSPQGTHNGILHPSGKYLIDIWSDTTVCREYLVIDNKGNTLQTLYQSEDPLRDFEIGKTKLFTLAAGDQTKLYCRIILPPDLDNSKKYPAIVYVYGGPHAQLVRNSWLGGANYFLNYLAQEGYVVFTLDNRGSANRGLAFEQAIFRNLGSMEVDDQMVGVNYLKSLPYVDDERIGINGWSYGGFMTISLMLKKPGIFKAGACGGPVTDWKFYEVMYGERYMDTPSSNPEGYKQSSLLDKAGNLDGNLLIIHGTADPVVVWQHSQALLKEFISEGKPVEYFVYPGHGHGVGGKDRLHLNQKLKKFFDDHL
jgi:dipeptidyl-peptidase-4